MSVRPTTSITAKIAVPVLLVVALLALLELAEYHSLGHIVDTEVAPSRGAAILSGARIFLAVNMAALLGVWLLVVRLLRRDVSEPLRELAGRVLAETGGEDEPGERTPAARGGTAPAGCDSGAGAEMETLRCGMEQLVHEAKRKEELCNVYRTLDDQRRLAEAILESTTAPLFAIDREHRIIAWNRAMAELSGLGAEEVIGTTRQWVPFYPSSRPTLADLVMDGELAKTGSYYDTFTVDTANEGMVRAEAWFQALNGESRYLFFDAAPVIRNGEPIAVVETLRDITERVRAQDSLRLFSRAVDQSSSSILITDRSGTIQYVNRKFCEVTGYTAEEVLGQTPKILKSGRQPSEVYQVLWETIAAGHEWQGEFNNRRKDGTVFWVNALISPICDQAGNVTHFLGITEDITSRKQAERELVKKQAELVLQHEQLTSLFRQMEHAKLEWEQTMDCIDDMLALADSRGRIRRCNRAFAALAGCAYPEILNRDWRVLLREGGLDPEAVESESGEIYHEGSRRWLSLKSYSYGNGSGEVITLHDLTSIREVSDQLSAAYLELKETHSQLLHQEKMASIGQLAAGVAHEINNPIGFISSNLTTMGKYLGRLENFLALQSAGVEEFAPAGKREEMAQARREMKIDYVLKDAHSLIDESQDGTERVRTIVQNLKSFSRIDDSQASWVDLNECLESTITIAWNELKYKTTLKRDYGQLPQVKCLAQQLNQVFLNILVNAAHAIEKQGDITVATRHEGDQVSIAIGDTGCGIPPEVVNRIFEPFFTTKEIGKGTGLGLSISYDIIKNHNGTIEVESTPGVGTTFTIRLPVGGDKP
ncbi:PAS domain S-box protein [Geomonas sp. Red32]|uniref:PAS domain S-box protein n=1 Tax=Geomonas sp. Red32 TaxID=2912856 RepID=UPI00202CDC30|nr:PAS domain S-box protein [Geomonas sp. Red32]MCM0080400.1 PAS domain S-box protein [Geomonas sp. Red32]